MRFYECRFQTTARTGPLARWATDRYGFGLFVAAFDERPEISHGGGIVGFTAFLGSFTSDDLIVVTLTNTDSARLYDGLLARELARAVAGRGVTAPMGGAAEVAVLDRLAGTYRMGSATITVERNGNGLKLSGESSVEQLWEHEFVARGNDMFEASANSEYRLSFTPTAPSGMRLSMTLSGRAIGDAVRP